jgi:cbb3-type cytochrome oxidase subunit 3
MKSSFTPVHKRKPCIFLSAFLLCVLVTGYYDQAYDSTAYQGYGYFNLNDDSNDLDAQKNRVRHSEPGITCIFFHAVHEVIVYSIPLEKPINVTSFNLLTNAYRAPPEKSS